MNENAEPWERGEPVFSEMLEATGLSCSPLNVHVDFNALFEDKGDEAYEIVAKLKDLLA